MQANGTVKPAISTIMDPNLASSTMPCKVRVYYYIDENGQGEWLYQSSFERKVKDLLVSLSVMSLVNEGHFVSPAIDVAAHYARVEKWLNRGKGINAAIASIDFSSSFRAEVLEAQKALGLFGDGVEPHNIVFDVLSFGSPKAFTTVGKLLISTVKNAAVVLGKGSKVAVVSAMLRAGERRAVGKLTERGVLQELNFLKSGQAAGKVESFSVKSSKFVNEAGQEATGDLRYLIDEAGNGGWVVDGVSGAGNVLITRTNWINNLKSQYGTFDISNFKPQGLNAADVPSATYYEMLGEYPSGIDDATRQAYLNGLINSGSTATVKRTFNAGDELYKIVPKGEDVTPYTPFFMTKAEFETLEATTNIEQKLGLPLISHSVEYDVYKIIATQQAKAFENTIANTLEKTFTTTGGGKQMLVIDRSKWSAAVKIKTIMPNQ